MLSGFVHLQLPSYFMNFFEVPGRVLIVQVIISLLNFGAWLVETDVDMVVTSSTLVWY